MVELDKPVTMANYVFILLSTMMTSIAFNHVILRGLIIEDTDTDTKEDELTPNETIQNLYNLKIGLETKVSELQALIEEYNKITGTEDQDKINKLEIKLKIDAKYLEYQTELSAYKTKATGDYKKIFKFKYDDTEYPLVDGYQCTAETGTTEFFVNKVDHLYNTFKASAAGATPPNDGSTPNAGGDGAAAADGTPNAGGDGAAAAAGAGAGAVAGGGTGAAGADGTSGGTFTNTSFEGFSEGRYKLTDEGQLKDEEYTQNITNGSIAVYIFAVLISIAGLFYHTRGYHIIGALINMAIAAMGLHLWTLYHEKKDNLAEIDKSYMENIILASFILCLLTFTVFIFAYVHDDDRSF